MTHAILPHVPLLLLLAITVFSPQSACQTPTDEPEDLSCSVTIQDSLELHLLDLDIEKARLNAARTDLWHRLIPSVSLSASLGVKDIFFIDPNTSLPYVLPRDVYRLTLTLPLSEILDNSQHALAELQIAQLQAQHARLLDHQQGTRQLLRQKLLSLEAESQLLRDQIRMSEDIIRFRQLLFEQGKLHYDVLVRSHLDLLDARKSLYRLNIQQAELRLQVRPPDSAVGPASPAGRRDSKIGSGIIP